jgi:hypothetical protein
MYSMDTLKIFLISQFKQLAYTAVDLPTSRSPSLEFNREKKLQRTLGKSNTAVTFL